MLAELGGLTVKRYTAKASKFNEEDHPRDDAGHFVSKDDMAAAASDPGKAKELRDRVTDPKQRAKLDAAIGKNSKDKPAAKPAAKPTPKPKTSTPKSTKPRVPEKAVPDRVARAKASAKLVDKSIQRYAEEHNEPKFAQSIGGLSFKDNEPVDVVVGDDGVIKHGIELKTMVSNKANKITMKRSAMERKAEWEKNNKATFHTVVIDDHKVFNAKGEGQHDESKRAIYYRRGFGSFRVNTMHRVKDMAELKKLLDTPNEQLPDAARRSATKV